MRLTRLSPAVLLTALALSASAQPVRPKMPQAPKDACVYITRETAARLFGGPVEPAKSQLVAADSMSSCMFPAPKADLAVNLLISALPPGMDGAAFFQAMTKPSPGSHITLVEGLGEHAAYTSDGAALNLVVLVHGFMVSLGVTGPDTPARRAAMFPVLKPIVASL